MTIQVYNTIGGKKEPLVPVVPGKIGMYVCGPTVYDYSHIGHARSVVVFDVIARYLKAAEFEVTYVRNFTDVDDKIIRRAAELDEDPARLAERFIAAFYDDMDALNVQRADAEPRVTAFIPQIIALVEKLIATGHAYAVDGDVFYAVETFGGYGKLSGRKLKEMEAGARVAVDRRKRSPFDFALWKSAKPGEPAWPSPWGEGRPGWHIECSAMSSELLGETFDIHGGGKDLIFPHHENEIAQSEGAFGKTFARYWMHNGFVNIDQEKMSKSLGNFLMIRDVIRTYHPEAVRLFLLSSQYRSPIDFSDQAMDEANARLDRLYALMQRIEQFVPAEALAGSPVGSRPLWEDFCACMDDDFNTAKGIAVLFEASRHLNAQMDDAQAEPGGNLHERLVAARSDILTIARDILGVLKLTPAEYFEAQRKRKLARTDVDAAAIEKLIGERADARRSKDWRRADEIRDRILKLGILLEDRPEGTVWKFKDR